MKIINLVYACHACNMYKSATWNPQVPAVLHPLHTDMTLHIRYLPEGTVQGLLRKGTGI
jgi:hypothetical protein